MIYKAITEFVPNLTTLRLDACPNSTWSMIHLILEKLPKLENLSLTSYYNYTGWRKTYSESPFCEAISKLTELKSLNLCSNVYVTNDVLKQISQSCPKLTTLNISNCNTDRLNETSG